MTLHGLHGHLYSTHPHVFYLQLFVLYFLDRSVKVSTYLCIVLYHYFYPAMYMCPLLFLKEFERPSHGTYLIASSEYG